MLTLPSTKESLYKTSLRIFSTDFWSEVVRKQFCLNFDMPREEAPILINYDEVYQEIQTVPEEGLCEESWERSDMADAHFVLFNGSISLLTLSGETEEKLDILSWIFAPNYQERLRRGKIVKVHVSELPFSFYRCAKEIGIVDVDEFREKLLTYFEPEVRDKLMKYIELSVEK